MQAESRFLHQWNSYIAITAESGVKTRRLTHGLVSWGMSVQNLLYATVVVVGAPLVAFDVKGTRLGMGGGFYDRAFAFRRDPGYRGDRPVLLGLGYELQRVAEQIRQPWDVPLDAAATEETLHLFVPPERSR